MEIKLSKKDEQKVTKEDKYTPLKQSTKFKTQKEKDICEAYYSGFRMKDIMKEYNVSSGTVQSVVNNYGKLNRRENLKVEERVKHVLNDSRVLQNLFEDYQYMRLSDIYSKYNIHKNGLYYILDKYDVPRKSDERELLLRG